MGKRVKSNLRLCLRSFAASLLFAIIAAAVLVQLGRVVFPVLSEYRTTIERVVSAQVGAEVRIGALEARWHGLTPAVLVTGLEVSSEQGLIFSARELALEWNLLTALRDWRAGIRTLQFEGLEVTFEQEASGQWRIAGLPEPTTASADDEGNPIIDDPVDVFVFGRRLELANTRLLLKYHSELELEVAVPLIQLENDNRFHRINASLNVEGEQALTVVVEGYGDPRDDTTFNARGFVQSNGFSVRKLLHGLSDAGLLDRTVLNDQTLPAGGNVNLALWFKGARQGGIQVVGRVKLDQLQNGPAQGETAAADVHWPQSLAAELRGHWAPNEGWQLGVGNASASWGDYQSPDLHLLVEAAPEAPVRIRAGNISLQDWLQTALKTGLLQGELKDVLTTLDPSGTLLAAEVTITDKARGYFQLAANLHNGEARPWEGAPGLSGVTGHLEANAFDGHITLASEAGFTMEFPSVYHQPLSFQRAVGDVRWTIYPEQKWVGVSSGNVHLAGEDYQGQGSFNLRIPYQSRPGFEPEMTLVVGVPRARAHYHKTFVPYTVPDTLYQWLGDSDAEGVAEDIAFVYHGTLMNHSDMPRVVQLAADVQSASLSFDKHWPRLQRAQAHLLVDDDTLVVTGLNGELQGSRVHNARVRLRDRPGGRGQEVAVGGELQGATAQLMQLLLSSPAQQQMDASMAEWALSGSYQAQFDVAVPLQAGQDTRQDIRLTLTDNSLGIPLSGLHFERLSGTLQYSDASGLSAESIQARLWDKPVSASISTDSGKDGSLRIEFDGTVAMADIQRWSERPELQFARGESRVTGHVAFPHSGEHAVQVEVSSDLTGVTLNLPAPFTKAADTQVPMRLRMHRQRQSDFKTSLMEFDLVLDSGVNLHWKHNQRRLVGMTLAFNGASPRVEPGKIHINGRLGTVPGLEWYDLITGFYGSTESASGAAVDDSSDDAVLPIQANLVVESLQLDQLHLPQVKAQAWGRDGRWRVDVQNPQLAGRLNIVPGAPMKADLEYLKLPASDAADAGPGQGRGAATSALAGFNTQSLEPLDFATDELWLGDKPLGRWQFKLRRTTGGMVAYDVFADYAGLKLAGRNGRGAQLVWLQHADGQHSYFDGNITGGDIGVAIEQLQGQKILTSASTELGISLEWPGAPDQATLTSLTGLVDLDLNRGRFIRGATAGENPLVKLLGLLNFDTLARRLRLDFSDLHPEGMGYERVQGQLEFVAGSVHIPTPLQVDSPAIALQLVGDVDLQGQTIDAQLVATLPFGGNLTFAAALTGGVPIAVGVYVLGKVFKEQMDRASSIRYDIIGPWAEPEVKFDRIFDDSTTKGQGNARSQNPPHSADSSPASAGTERQNST